MPSKIRSAAIACALAFVLSVLPAEPAFSIGGSAHSNTQGFDNCEAQSTAFYNDWISTNSPFWQTIAYFAGGNRACANTALSPSWFNLNAAYGYAFYLTFVGKQSYCNHTAYAYTISQNTATAFNEGYAAAGVADTAVDNFLLTGTLTIEFDLEGYTNNPTGCRAAAASFIEGWDEGLEAAGHFPSVYGSSVSSYLVDFKSISTPPVVVRAANVASPPNPDVNHIDGLDPSWWQHSRHKQWAVSAHTKTYGSHTLTGPGSTGPALDWNCDDGLVSPNSASQLNSPTCGN